MPSQLAPPVLHEFAGWLPYQQQTSTAWVIESPIAATLLGSGAAAAVPTPGPATTDTTASVAAMIHLRMSPSALAQSLPQAPAAAPLAAEAPAVDRPAD